MKWLYALLLFPIIALADQATIKSYTDCFEHEVCTGKVYLQIFDDGRGRGLAIHILDEKTVELVEGGEIGEGWTLRAYPLDKEIILERVKVYDAGGRNWGENFALFVTTIHGMSPAVFQDDVWIDGVLPENWIDPNK